MPDPNYDLTTLDEVKTDLELTTATTYDDILEALIDAVSNWIENSYCKRQFLSRPYTEYIDGKGNDTIYLKHRPVTAVTTIHDDVDRVFDSNTLINSSEYYPYENEGYVRLFGETKQFFTRGIFQVGVANVKVVYVAGYETIPKAVNLACRKLVIKLFRQREKEGVKSESIGQYSITYTESKDVPTEIKMMLDGYVNMKV
ncbi:MAG: phage head-tail connector protein [Planctomycetota bacterium]